MKMTQLGDRFYCVFRHPVTKKSVRCALGGHAVALHNLERLKWLKSRPELWKDPPQDLPLCVREAWGVNTAGDPVEPGAIADTSAQLALTVSSQSEEIRRLNAHIVRLERELTDLRGRKYDGPDLSVKDAVDGYLEKLKGLDPQWEKVVRSVLKRFAQSWQVPLSTMAGRERAIRSWISGLEISAGASVQYRNIILKFLADSGCKLDRREVGGWKISRKSPIQWLTLEEARAVAEQLPAPWNNVFRVQVGTGLRPTELPTLKKGDLRGDMLTLSDSGNLTLKTGSRSLRVAKPTLALLRRLIKKGHAFKNKGKPYSDPERFCRHYRKALHAVPDAPFQLDCRTGRRTCASLMLRAGRSVEEVAAYLGDDPATIRKHYARILPHEVDGSASAI